MISILIKIFRIIRNHIFFTRKSLYHNIKLFNYQWDKAYYPPNHWLYQFIVNRVILKKNKKISIYSVNGHRESLLLDPCSIRIFYTVENVHVPLSHWALYDDLLLNDNKTKLSLGYDYIDNSKYLRFPYWIMTTFDSNSPLKHIYSLCEKLETPLEISKSKFCAFICRSDYFGDRAKFADMVSQIEKIHYPGDFRHNDDSLKTDYNDNKIEYLKQFKFNLCPENSNYPGYVTEKVFDAIKAGCLPIYWGSDNCPEPEILNQNRILFLRLDGDNTEVLSLIRSLNEDVNAYNEFYNQPVFKSNAAEIIYAYFERLEQKLREVIK